VYIQLYEQIERMVTLRNSTPISSAISNVIQDTAAVVRNGQPTRTSYIDGYIRKRGVFVAHSIRTLVEAGRAPH
jgi:hypothetical protein